MSRLSCTIHILTGYAWHSIYKFDLYFSKAYFDHISTSLHKHCKPIASSWFLFCLLFAPTYAIVKPLDHLHILIVVDSVLYENFKSFSENFLDKRFLEKAFTLGKVWFMFSHTKFNDEVINHLDGFLGGLYVDFFSHV